MLVEVLSGPTNQYGSKQVQGTGVLSRLLLSILHYVHGKELIVESNKTWP